MPTKAELARVDAIKDEDIDYSDNPEWTEEMFQRAEWIMPAPKESITMRLDGDIVDWFKARGRGYQTRINAVLRAYIGANKSAASKTSAARPARSGGAKRL